MLVSEWRWVPGSVVGSLEAWSGGWSGQRSAAAGKRTSRRPLVPSLEPAAVAIDDVVGTVGREAIVFPVVAAVLTEPDPVRAP